MLTDLWSSPAPRESSLYLPQEMDSLKCAGAQYVQENNTLAFIAVKMNLRYAHLFAKAPRPQGFRNRGVPRRKVTIPCAS